MKINIVEKIIPLILLFFVLNSCTDPATVDCKISKFYWEDQWHKAHYNSVGRLTSLEADSSRIFFHYNGAMQLVKAEIYKAAPSPAFWFEFIHGPHGIIETNEYHLSTLGVERNRARFHYASPSRVDYIIEDEYGVDPTPGFTIYKSITYTGNNVKHIAGSSSVINTAYTAGKYDKNKNPFMLLASAVGNPVFFPVCKMVSFPVSDYDISYLNLFSANNPFRAQYEIPGSGLTPEAQLFSYSYSGSMAEKILWKNSNFGTITMEDYVFEFECSMPVTSME